MKRGFSTLREVTQKPRERDEARTLARLEGAWAWLVGPALAGHTRPLALRNNILIMGCWKSEVMSALRASVEEVWPTLQARLKVGLRLGVFRMDVVPCDPPPPPKPKVPEQEEDPLLRALEAARSARNRGWTPVRK